MSARGRVLVLGAINVDLVTRVERLPRPGETVVGADLERHGGGKGANAAVAASRQGAQVTLVGAVGSDDLGEVARAELDAEGVDCGALVSVPDRPTGTANIVVDAAGENQIAVAAGANLALDADAVARTLHERLPGTDLLLVSTEVPDAVVLVAVATARRAGVRCVLNPAPPRAALVPALDGAPLLTPNRGELRALADAAGVPAPAVPASTTGGAGIDAGGLAADARALGARTGAAVVVTLGGDGALVAGDDQQTWVVPAAPARVRDTTGAGDAFNGILAAALANDAPLAAAVNRAVAGAALAVSGEGARSAPDHASVDAALTAR